MMTSILSKARNEGYREGLAQAGEAEYHHAYEQGWIRGHEAASSHIGWKSLLVGVLTGAVIAFIVLL